MDIDCEQSIIRDRVLAQLDLSRELTDAEINEGIEREIAAYAHTMALSLNQREQYGREIFNSMRKLDVLQELIEDESVTEIMVNGSYHIFYEKEGRIYRWNKQFISEDKLSDTIQQIVGINNRIVNEAAPIADTRLKDGSRVNIVLSPIAIDGSAVSIRKFPKEPLSMKRLIHLGALKESVAEYLGILVRAGYNILVSGGTGSGKTTFLNALAEYIPKDARLITIEDSAEMQIKNIANLVRLETRSGVRDGTEEITIRDLIRTALRMRPDRIIVGECRGPEALDMLQAMNTGHDGSFSTGHANSAGDMLSRLETMVLTGMELPVSAIRRQIASGIDILVHLGRLRDCSRKVLEIIELDGVQDGEIRMQTLWQYREQQMKGGIIQGTWHALNPLIHRQKIQAAGLESLLRQREEQLQQRKDICRK